MLRLMAMRTFWLLPLALQVGCGPSEPRAIAEPSPTTSYTYEQDCGVAEYKQYPHLADDRSYAADNYLGLSSDEAEARARAEDLEVRILGIDGNCEDRTDDLRRNRVNFYLEDGVVTAAARY